MHRYAYRPIVYARKAMCVIIAEELFELVQLSGVPMDKELFKVVRLHASNAPINVKPHYPPYGHNRGYVGI